MVRKNCLWKLLGLLLLTSTAEVYAIEFIVGTALDSGGDTITTLHYNAGTSQEIKAGNGLELFAGLKIPFSQSSGIRTTIGYKFDTPSVKDGTVGFSRIPFEILGYFESDMIYVSAGVSLHSHAKFECNVSSICNSIADFENAQGAKLEAGFKIAKMLIGLRMTRIEYIAPTGTIYDGSALGLFVSL